MGRRLAAGAALAAVALLGGVIAIRATSGPVRSPVRAYLPAASLSPAPATVSAPAPLTPTPPRTVAPPQPTSGWIATLAAPTKWSASPGGPPIASLAATNPYGAPQTVAVTGAPGVDAWLHVELPVRPNGTAGWIPSGSAHLTWTPYAIQVSLAARSLTLRRGSEVVLRSSVAVGAPSTPTPLDHTYVWELVAPGDPTGSYGPDIFGLAEFSDAYSVFNGGDAQIGIHGSDEPWSIGEAASHGCIRLPNSTVRELVGILPLGTPVTIG